MSMKAILVTNGAFGFKRGGKDLHGYTSSGAVSVPMAKKHPFLGKTIVVLDKVLITLL